MDHFANHPSIFGSDIRRYGIACNPGWNAILDELFAALAKDTTPVKVLQVKEKFGGLRCYIDGGSSAAREAILHAEKRALETCEDCGAPGKARSLKWLRTLCDTHYAERKARD